jgi:hypothetical protein
LVFFLFSLVDDLAATAGAFRSFPTNDDEDSLLEEKKEEEEEEEAAAEEDVFWGEEDFGMAVG